MNGIHDMGGMHGFGKVDAEGDEPVFHEAWEGRVFGLALMAFGAGIWNGDAFRHAIERLDPVAYLSAGYFGRWLAALEKLLLEAGVVGPTDVEARVLQLQEGAVPKAPASSAPVSAAGVTLRTLDARRSLEEQPRFRLGQSVVAHNRNPAGHTRLPRYVRGRRGCIVRVHPAFVYPDTHAHGLGENPQYVYCVRFEAVELWGTDAEARCTVHLDLFESYLDAG
jgi:nitrile hydratase